MQTALLPRGLVLAIAAVSLGLCGCHSVRTEVGTNNKHVSQIKVTRYDSTKRPPTSEVEVYANFDRVSRPNKPIGRLTCQGSREAGPAIVDALVYEARQLGAEGLILLQPITPQTRRSLSVPTADAPDIVTYQADALVYVVKP
jgi:hypothetical protein